MHWCEEREAYTIVVTTELCFDCILLLHIPEIYDFPRNIFDLTSHRFLDLISNKFVNTPLKFHGIVVT